MSFISADGRLSPSLRLADGRQSPSLRLADEFAASRAATTVAESVTEIDETDTGGDEPEPIEAAEDNVEDEVSSIEANIRKDTEALIGTRRMTREKRLVLVVEMLKRKYQLDARVQRLARRLENTKMQTIRLDSRSESRQLSDRQGNQLLTYAYMVGVAEDKLEPFGDQAVVAGREAVIDVAWRAIWGNEGPGSSHSEKAMVPFLSMRGIHVASDLPRTVVGFAELALQYAHEMHQMLFDEVKKMEIYMRNELKDEVHGVATMEREALQMAYMAHQLNLAPTAPMVAMAVPVDPTDAPSNLPATQVELYVAPWPLLTVQLPLDSDDDEAVGEATNSVVASISAPASPAPCDDYFEVLLKLEARVRGIKRPRLEVENEVCVA